MKSKLRLHLANGTVYLKGYENIDLKLPESHLAKDRPDLVEENLTDFDHYYKEIVNRNKFLSGELHHKEIVCDMFSDIRDLPFEPNSVDEILAVQVFEHFTYKEGKELFEYWTSLLKPGGVLHLDVPDLDRTIEIYQSDPEWATRLLYGSQKNEWGIHKAMYNHDTLRALYKEFGYRDIEAMPNMHTYPAFGMKGIKK